MKQLILIIFFVLSIGLMIGVVTNHRSVFARWQPTSVPLLLERIDSQSSLKYYDVALNDQGEVMVDTETFDNSWLPNNPGQGKTKYKTAIYIPRDYLIDVGVDLPDIEIQDVLASETVNSIRDYEEFLEVTIEHDATPVIVHSELTLEEMLCSYGNPDCNDWGYLIHRAFVDVTDGDNDPDAYYAIYILGGAGVAGAGWSGYVIGDWGFSQLLGYEWPNCGSNCSYDRFLYTVRHEMGHSHGIPWHTGGYPNYPYLSIMDAGTWDNFYLVDHPGYPERYQICRSSLNTGMKYCESRFSNPDRDDTEVRTLRGHLINPACERYDVTQQVFFSFSPQGRGWGRRYFLGATHVNEFGEFEMRLSGQDTTYWQRGYALTVADAFPIPDPDVNEFVHGYQFHYDPNKQAWCDDNTGQVCHDSEYLVLQVPESACDGLRPTPPTKPFAWDLIIP